MRLQPRGVHRGRLSPFAVHRRAVKNQITAAYWGDAFIRCFGERALIGTTVNPGGAGSRGSTALGGPRSAR